MNDIISFVNTNPLANYEFAEITIPCIDKQQVFSGSFIVKDDKIRLYLECYRNDPFYKKICALLESEDLFSVFLRYRRDSSISCFDCFSVTDLITITEQSDENIQS